MRHINIFLTNATMELRKCKKYKKNDDIENCGHCCEVPVEVYVGDGGDDAKPV